MSVSAVTEGDRTGNLSPRQEAACLALLAGSDTTAAARVAGVSERTMRRWVASMPFREALRAEARSQAQQARAYLLGAQRAAVATLRQCLHAESAATRTRAARAILELGVKHTEIDHEDRLADLERRMHEWQHGTASAWPRLTG